MLNNFCGTLSPLLQLIGEFLVIFKISLPLILIILAIFDIAKAVISSKSDDVKKHLKGLLGKIAICVIVYFVPMIISLIFTFVSGFNEIVDESGMDYQVCYDCMFSPYSSTCQDSVSLNE